MSYSSSNGWNRSDKKEPERVDARCKHRHGVLISNVIVALCSVALTLITVRCFDSRGVTRAFANESGNANVNDKLCKRYIQAIGQLQAEIKALQKDLSDTNRDKEQYRRNTYALDMDSSWTSKQNDYFHEAEKQCKALEGKIQDKKWKIEEYREKILAAGGEIPDCEKEVQEIE